MSKYSKYPSYKDSGIEWLGEIPEHWSSSRLKFLCNITTGGKDTENKIDDGQYPFYVRSQTVERINSYSYDGEAILTAGDGVGVGKVFHYVEGKFDFHQRVYMFYSFRKVIGKFLFEYIKNNFYKVALAGVAKSTVDSLRLPLIQNFMITVPPLQEQKAIATYLDRATQKIDSLIAKQSSLIALLKEKRQALISHAVTKGVENEELRMKSEEFKDSGVEWLGEIPEGWEVWKMSHAFNTIGSGTTPSSTKSSYYNGHIPWVTTGELRENIIFNTKKLLTDEAIRDNTSLKLFPINAIVIAMYGATIGRLGVLGIKATTNQACCVMTDSSSIKNQYLYYWLMGYRDEIIKLGYGGGQPNISQDTISSLKISAPNIAEQNLIVTYLDQKTQKIDTLISKATDAITLLKEKRTALISAVVTGKIDVRGEVT